MSLKHYYYSVTVPLAYITIIVPLLADSLPDNPVLCRFILRVPLPFDVSDVLS